MLLIHRAERADALVAALGEILSVPSGDPFAPEVVAVPTMGVERWLAQQLSHRLGAVADDGVCANVVFTSSTRMLDEAVAGADDGYAAAVERWAAERAVWPLMKIIDEQVQTAPWAGVLAVHLGLSDGDTDRGRRFAVASSLARLFGTYASARPGMLRAWRADRDEQGDGTPLPADLRWQAELWRLLRADLGAAPAELLETACAALRTEPDRAGLPQRLSIFGATRIAPARIEILTALAEHREIHLWLHHPSPALWRKVTAGPGRRQDDETGEQLDNPLLASLSRDVRELQQLLPAAGADTYHPTAPRPDTILGRLQTGLAEDSTPGAPRQVRAADRSLTVHACHGPARQVEVVREAVLGLLEDDPTLEPRDILIMCPDVETFAPLVAASFGMLDEPDGHPAAKLRVRLADRSLRQTNPLLSLLSQLLELAANRITATQLLDLAGAPPVRALFGFDDDDIEQLRDWAGSANARWGLDAEHRAPYGLSLDQGTWRAAIDRMLLGVAMEEGDSWLGDVLPLDDIDSGKIELAGRFAELLDRVDTAVRALAIRRTVPQWAALLGTTVLELGEPSFAWQAAQLTGELAELAEAAGATDVELTRADVAALLAGQLAGRPTRASFRTGTLTVCTLVPMRSVPHRVVCLVGMDDGVFPRHGLVAGDDILARVPRTGERAARSEDRQLFLDAICAAQEHLIITYTGADPRTGAEVPPCVPLGELLDAVDAGVRAPGGGPGREYVVIRHPLQPFDARNFTIGSPAGDLGTELGRTGPFSFDPAALAGARAASLPRHPRPALVPAPLGPPARTDTIDLEDLVRFVQHPARAFLRQRLGISTYSDDHEPTNALPVELDGLQTWAIGDRMLGRCVAGMSRKACAEIELRRGELPPGPLGQVQLTAIGANIDALLRACEVERQLPATSVDISISLADGRRLSGTVGGVRGSTVLSVSYSSLAGKHRLAAWVRHLAIVVALADSNLRSVTVGRGRRGSAARKILRAMDPAAARRTLEDLIALRDAGLREPLPMAVAATEAYADRRQHGSDDGEARKAAQHKWQEDKFSKENVEPEHILVFGGVLPLTELFTEPDDSRPDESSRFGALARRLWTPLLDAEIEVRP